MKITAIFFILAMSSHVTFAQVCGRFSSPVKSVLKQSTLTEFDFKKITTLSDAKASHCLYYRPQSIRCDIIYDNKKYFFFFNKELLTADWDQSFKKWLEKNNGKQAVINVYNTLFEWDNDFEQVECPNWYEQLTYTLTIDGKESVIIE